MMKYGVRVALGAVLGLALSAGLAFWLGSWWIGALAGGLGGPVAFLATFFVWSADRPEEGYEQVLFDRPNTILGGVMLVALSGVAFGVGWIAGPGDAGLDPEEQAALARMDESHGELLRLSKEYATANEARSKGGDPGDLDADADAARDARVALQTLEAPESLAPLQESLLKSAKALEAAFEALKACAAGEEPECLDARIGHADAVRGMQAYAEEKSAL